MGTRSQFFEVEDGGLWWR